MNHNHYLLMWLEAPLQSWGVRSKYDRRDTLNFPSKSGIIGLICSALGAGGDQKALLSKLTTCGMKVLVTQKKVSSTIAQNLSLRLTDFHVVGNGYDADDPWQKLLIPKKTDGKKAVGGGSKLTYRDYLQDKKFAVILTMPQNLAQQVAEALQAPVWDLFLGRKCCIPTEFIYQGLFDNEQAVNDYLQQLLQNKQCQIIYQVVEHMTDDEYDDKFTLQDVPIQFGTDKRYTDREVYIINQG